MLTLKLIAGDRHLETVKHTSTDRRPKGREQIGKRTIEGPA